MLYGLLFVEEACLASQQLIANYDKGGEIIATG